MGSSQPIVDKNAKEIKFVYVGMFTSVLSDGNSQSI